MNIKVLGTQAPYVRYGHNGPGYLVTTSNNKNILLDCGSGSTHMMKFPHDLQNLMVVISHRHGDHWADLFPLMYASYTYHEVYKALDNKIRVYIPSDMNHVVRMEKFHWCEFINIYPDMEVSIDGAKTKFCKTIHADNADSYAVKIQDGDKSLVYTGDISFESKERIVELARHSNMLISESTLLESYNMPEYNVHITAKQAARIAFNAEVDKLLLTHFKPEEDPDNYVLEARKVFTNTLAAMEGLKLNV